MKTTPTRPARTGLTWRNRKASQRHAPSPSITAHRLIAERVAEGRSEEVAWAAKTWPVGGTVRPLHSGGVLEVTGHEHDGDGPVILAGGCRGALIRLQVEDIR